MAAAAGTNRESCTTLNLYLLLLYVIKVVNEF